MNDFDAAVLKKVKDMLAYTEESVWVLDDLVSVTRTQNEGEDKAVITLCFSQPLKDDA